MSKADGQSRSFDETDRLIALCLGAHRSGTSLITAAIEALGAHLALPHHEASDENAKGFFEHAEVVALDDDILRAAGSAWDDVTFDSRDLVAIPAEEKARLEARARQLVESEFRPASLAAVKDPRISRLLPFWLPVLRAEGYADNGIRCIIVTRDPVEVAVSQRTRVGRNSDFYDFGENLVEGALMWSSHVQQALRDCAGRDILVISYRDFLARPVDLMNRMARFLGAAPEDGAIKRFVDQVVSLDQWRSRAAASDIAKVEKQTPGLVALESRLAALSGRVVSTSDLAPIVAAFGEMVAEDDIRRVVSQAYGRLSDRRRVERAEALRDRHALGVAVEARDAFERERDALVSAVAEQEKALRERIAGLELGVTERDRKLASLQNEQAAAICQIAEAFKSNERELAETRNTLASVQNEQAAAIRQISEALKSNERQLAETRSTLASGREELATVSQKLRQAEYQRGALEQQLQEAARRLESEQSAARQMQRDVDQLSRDLTTASEISSYLVEVTEAMRASHSWRLTKPLRTSGTALRSAILMPKTGLRGLNRASQVVHQRLKRSHPKTAEVLRRSLQPLLTRANMKLLGQYTVPTPPSRSTVEFAFDYQLPQVHGEFRPLVTIIVPNYNHADYLAQRLESIFAQSYDNYEVLLLDDFSTDESRDILTRFANRYPEKARAVFNDANSGGVFHQWEKGLAEAKGDLIWIAESDDWASSNFLETLVPFFQNEAVQLAYARTIFVDAAGENQIWSMEEYLNDYGPDRWGKAWVETAPDIVRDAFSMVNIVPNVSSAVFRRFDRLDVLEIDDWRNMRTCGDWMFYLNAIRGGMMAYSPDAQNYYRIHDKNTSVTSHKADQFYREHEDVAKCVRRHYSVPNANVARMEANLRHHWKLTRDDYSEQAFAACFDPVRIEAAPPRKPNLMMVSYAFCSGGGEAFPIQLANEMKAIGYQVTFLDCAQEQRLAGVRNRLATDIPVISNFPDLRRIVQNFDIDVIHSHHGWADNTVLDVLPENDRSKTVITLHGFYETMPSDQLKALLPRLLRRTSAMVYIADKNLAPMKRAGEMRADMFHRIDNAVSKNAISPVDLAALGIPDDAFVLVVVSRALLEKGWAEAIASTIRARELSGRDIHLILVGDGEGKKAAEAAGVPQFVHLEGFQPNTQDYFAAADLGFLPSRFKGESFPLVVIESLIAGTPVLASNIGEIGYMLGTKDGPAGVLFDLDDDWSINTERLAHEIARLATDPDELARLRFRVPLAAGRFDPRLMAEKYDAVYRKIAQLDEAQTNHVPRLVSSAKAAS